MAEITQFIPDDSGCDPEATAVVCTAHDRASLTPHDRGHARVAREIIAKRIIALAARPRALVQLRAGGRWSSPMKVAGFGRSIAGDIFCLFGLPFVGSIGGPLLQNLDLGRARLDAPVDMPRYHV